MTSSRTAAAGRPRFATEVLPAQEAHEPNERWEMDMTRVMLQGMIPVWRIVVIDGFTREIVGCKLFLRCRAKGWRPWTLP